jgi:hypothetical protein
MTDRRRFVISLAGAFAAISSIPALASKDANPEPTANLLPGHPEILDFGDGLKVPMSKAAFKTLWEDKDFWLTYGMGISNYTAKATGFATFAAIGTMKLLLLTLAFAPDRLEHVDGCGWKLKSQNPKDYVLGDISIPGQPFRPVTDANSSNATVGQIFSYSQGSMMSGNIPGAAAGAGNQMGLDVTGGDAKVHAMTGYIVWKKDVTLDYVRMHAHLL